MTRYVAFLRGVSPLNLKMADLARCVEHAGGKRVKTLLSSGNVAFDHPARSAHRLEDLLEETFNELLGRTFYTVVCTSEELQALVEKNPFSAFGIHEGAKPVVTFARILPNVKARLPIERDGAQILAVTEKYALAAYLPRPQDPAFMRLIEKTFGKDVTTRTWETVKKCARA